MKNLIKHLKESLRIGINDVPEAEIENYNGKNCLLIICTLRKNGNNFIRFYASKIYNIEAQEERDKMGYYLHGEALNGPFYFENFEVFPSEDFSIMYWEEKNTNNSSGDLDLYVFINPSLNDQVIKLISDIDEEKQYSVNELLNNICDGMDLDSFNEICKVYAQKGKMIDNIKYIS